MLTCLGDIDVGNLLKVALDYVISSISLKSSTALLSVIFELRRRYLYVLLVYRKTIANVIRVPATPIATHNGINFVERFDDYRKANIKQMSYKHYSITT